MKESNKLYKNEIDRVIEDNRRLEKGLKEYDIAYNKLESEIYSMKNENTSLLSKIRAKDDSVSHLQQKYEEANKTILRLSNNLKEVDGQNEKFKTEINNINSTLNREVKSRDRRIDDLERTTREKDIELKRTIESLGNVTVQKDKLYDDNNRMFSELEYLRSQINKLTNTNSMVSFCLF